MLPKILIQISLKRKSIQVRSMKNTIVSYNIIFQFKIIKFNVATVKINHSSLIQDKLLLHRLYLKLNLKVFTVALRFVSF